MSDIPALRDLWRETWTAQYGPVLGDDLAPLLAMIEDERLTAMIPQQDETVLLAIAGETVIGSVIFAKRSLGAVWGMYVLPSHQRSGVGRALLRAAATAMQGVEVVMVVVLNASASAIAFYKACGFEAGEDTAHEIVPGRTMAARFMFARVEKLLGEGMN